MNKLKRPSQPKQNTTAIIRPRAGQKRSDPLTYNHPYDSMRRYAELLAVHYDCVRTQHSYYRAMRLSTSISRPIRPTLGEDHFRD